MSKNIHVKKFMGGRMTPMEAHQKWAWSNAKCTACNAPATLLCRTFAPFDELNRRTPEFCFKLAVENDGQIPMVKMTHGDYVLLGKAYACARCANEMQRAAAKGPSWCLHEFDFGPDPKGKISAQV